MGESPYTGVEWLQELRQRMLQILLGTVVILGSLGIAASLYRVIAGESASNLTYYLAAYAFALLLFFAPRLPFLRQLPQEWRAYAFLAGLYAFGVMALFSGWLVSSGRTFLVALVVAAAVLVGTRTGFAAAILDLLTFSAFGLAYSQGWLHLRKLPDPTIPAPIITEGVGFAIAIGITALGLWLIRRALSTAMHAIQEAHQVRQLLFERARQLDIANELLTERSRSLEQANAALQERVWISTAHGKLDDILRGEQDVSTLANRVLGYLCKTLNAQAGAFYVLENAPSAEAPGLQLVGKYAFAIAGDEAQISPAHRIGLGQGLVGQVAQDGRMQHVAGLELDPAVKAPLLRVQSGLGDALPEEILIVPVISAGQVNGVLELAALEPFNPLHINFLKDSTEKIGVTLATAQARARIETLLAEQA